jgi:hypothetical protein
LLFLIKILKLAFCLLLWIDRVSWLQKWARKFVTCTVFFIILYISDARREYMPTYYTVRNCIRMKTIKILRKSTKVKSNILFWLKIQYTILLWNWKFLCQAWNWHVRINLKTMFLLCVIVTLLMSVICRVFQLSL